MTRRDALIVVIALLSHQQAQAQTKTCHPVPEELLLNLGEGACTVKRIKIKQGLQSVTITTNELLSVLGAK